METEQYEEAVRDYEKVHKADRGNMEYRQLLQYQNAEVKVDNWIIMTFIKGSIKYW